MNVGLQGAPATWGSRHWLRRGRLAGLSVGLPIRHSIAPDQRFRRNGSLANQFVKGRLIEGAEPLFAFQIIPLCHFYRFRLLAAFPKSVGEEESPL